MHDNDILEISAGTTCDRQMIQCVVKRCRTGRNNLLGVDFQNLTMVVYATVTQQPTDLCIQITSNCNELLPLSIIGGVSGNDVESVSISQNCQMRWDFREHITQEMHGIYFEVYKENAELVATLVIVLQFHNV